MRPEDVLVEGGTAARIRDYMDYRAANLAFTLESLRRMDVDSKARYQRTKHLDNRFDADGKYVWPTDEETAQGEGPLDC